MARRVTRYRSSEAIEQGTEMTRAALARIFALAKARGARPLLLVPQFLPESEREREVRRDVLDAAHIPYLLVPVPAAERSPSHGHPDPRGARRIAEAVAAALR
jgi:lysophospholipase L1-like esterase